MNKPYSVYVVGGAINYASFLNNCKLTNDIKKANIVIFTGGEDVDPSLYGHDKHPTTYSNLERDKYEQEMFNKISKNQFVLGICRGNQFLAVMNGFPLYQDIPNHAIWHTHPIENGDEVYEITSTHHQMACLPSRHGDNFDLLYEAHEICADDVIEAEIVHYHNPNLPQCLGIQGHPEIMRKDAPVVKMLNSLIDKLYKHD